MYPPLRCSSGHILLGGSWRKPGTAVPLAAVALVASVLPDASLSSLARNLLLYSTVYWQPQQQVTGCWAEYWLLAWEQELALAELVGAKNG